MILKTLGVVVSMTKLKLKILIGAKPLRISFDKVDLLEFMMKLDVKDYLEVKNMNSFTTELDVL